MPAEQEAAVSAPPERQMLMAAAAALMLFTRTTTDVAGSDQVPLAAAVRGRDSKAGARVMSHEAARLGAGGNGAGRLGRQAGRQARGRRADGQVAGRPSCQAVLNAMAGTFIATPVLMGHTTTKPAPCQ